MAKGSPRTNDCTPATRAGRLAKGNQFWEAATLIEELTEESDLVDAYITLCIHAGIAAADVICCARLGVHATGQSHDEAKSLLSTVDKGAARHLGTLLGMKTFSGDSSQSSPTTNRSRARRAALALLEAARTV